MIRFDLASARSVAADGGKQFRPALGYIAEARMLAEPHAVPDIEAELREYLAANPRQGHGTDPQDIQSAVDDIFFAAVFGVGQMLVLSRAVDDVLDAEANHRALGMRLGRPGCYVVPSTITDVWQVKPRVTGSTVDIFMRESVETLSQLQASMLHPGGSNASAYAKFEPVWEVERSIRRKNRQASGGPKRSNEPFTWARIRDAWAQQVEAVMHYQGLLNAHFLDGDGAPARSELGEVDIATLRRLSFDALSGVELAAHHRPSQVNGSLGMQRVGGQKWLDKRKQYEPKVIEAAGADSAVPLGVAGMTSMPKVTWTMCVGFNHVPIPDPLNDLRRLDSALGGSTNAGSRTTSSPIELLGTWVAMTSLERLAAYRVGRNGEYVIGESGADLVGVRSSTPRNMHSFAGHGALAPVTPML